MGQILTIADVAIIGLLLLSALWAFIRGFVRELLGVAAWVGAAFVTLYGFGYAQPYARQLISIDLVADAVTGVVIFVVSLILFSVISGAISSQVRQSSLSAIDRSLGFVFGLLRGAVIVCIAYLLLKWAVPVQDRPSWVMSARALPAIEQGRRRPGAADSPGRAGPRRRRRGAGPRGGRASGRKGARLADTDQPAGPHRAAARATGGLSQPGYEGLGSADRAAVARPQAVRRKPVRGADGC
ncbi:MAG: CvpA family protein [Pseudomonadota bacterium]